MKEELEIDIGVVRVAKFGVKFEVLRGKLQRADPGSQTSIS